MPNKLKVNRFVNADGEQVERLAMDIKGHDVQMVRIDHNDNAILVKVDRHVRQLPKARVNNWILRKLLGGRAWQR